MEPQSLTETHQRIKCLLTMFDHIHDAVLKEELAKVKMLFSMITNQSINFYSYFKLPQDCVAQIYTCAKRTHIHRQTESLVMYNL